MYKSDFHFSSFMLLFIPNLAPLGAKLHDPILTIQIQLQYWFMPFLIFRLEIYTMLLQ